MPRWPALATACSRTRSSSVVVAPSLHTRGGRDGHNAARLGLELSRRLVTGDEGPPRGRAPREASRPLRSRRGLGRFTSRHFPRRASRADRGRRPRAVENRAARRPYDPAPLRDPVDSHLDHVAVPLPRRAWKSPPRARSRPGRRLVDGLAPVFRLIQTKCSRGAPTIPVAAVSSSPRRFVAPLA